MTSIQNASRIFKNLKELNTTMQILGDSLSDSDIVVLTIDGEIQHYSIGDYKMKMINFHTVKSMWSTSYHVQTTYICKALASELLRIDPSSDTMVTVRNINNDAVVYRHEYNVVGLIDRIIESLMNDFYVSLPRQRRTNAYDNLMIVIVSRLLNDESLLRTAEKVVAI